MRPTQQSDVFHAISHPARRAILLSLKDGEHAAGDLAEPFRMSFAAISQHLRVLEDAALVSVRREGRRRVYRIEPAPLREVVTWVEEFAASFNQRLDALGSYLDKQHRKPGSRRQRASP